jgi:MoxR-like ATPase
MAEEAHPFYIYTGGGTPHERLKTLPAAPKWRSFVKPGEEDSLDAAEARDAEPLTEREEQVAATFQVDEKNRIRDAVNAALHLRRPLLVTGRPGTGKSSIVRSVALELRLGPVLTWNITSRSTLKDGLYEYDALGRLQEIQARQAAGNKQKVRVEDYITLGPLGTALLPGSWPKPVLIDEIDKADLDLPNDLLNLFEEGHFLIPELMREADSQQASVGTWKNVFGKQKVSGGQVACRAFPFIVLTSNGEREFSAPFLRRCVRLDIELPDDKMLRAIVSAHFKGKAEAIVAARVDEFFKRRGDGKLATDQLLNAVFLLESAEFNADERARLIELLYRELS